MPNLEFCRERILSNDYRDFIVSGIITSRFADIPPETYCKQTAGFGYQCIYLSQQQSDPITNSQFLYTSVPKCYAPISMDTLNQAGISYIQNYPTLQLKGNGVLIGFLDGGIDYTNPVFRNLDGSTRILSIWDQTVQTGTLPEGFAYGSEYTQEMINQALSSDSPLDTVPTIDTDGHGTFTASLAAGGGNPEQSFLGAAPEATLAVVKLKPAKQYLKDYYFIPDSTVCYQETDIALALHYLDQLARRYNLPLVFCFSLGTNAGGHIGALPCPTILNAYGYSSNRIPIIGTGNEADKRHHYYMQDFQNAGTQSVEIRVGENTAGFTMELWTSLPNVVAISLTSPSGENTARLPIRANGSTNFQFLLERTRVTIDYQIIAERETSELIFFRFFAPSPGIWRLNVEPVRIFDGTFHIWLPLTEFLSGEVFFLNSNPDYTITNPGNGDGSITAAYYDGLNNAVALSSGRGFSRNNQINPAIAAPGINVVGALPGNRFAARSGSSISTAVTAGAAALLVEWIIIDRGAPVIDAFQIRSLFIIGAVRPPEMNFPNREWGYGLLNLYNTFEEIRKF